jgi:iron complex transport system permease protein
MLVLSGIIVAAVFEALTSLVKYVADPEEKLPAITYWLMGSLSSVGIRDVFTGAPAILAGIVILSVLRCYRVGLRHHQFCRPRGSSLLTASAAGNCR